MPNGVQFGLIGNDLAIMVGDRPRKPFKPYAYYHPTLDRIYVYTEDESSTEIRVNEVFTLIKSNPPPGEVSQWIGFMIEPARRYCLARQIPTGESVILNQLLERLAIEYPLSEEIKIALGLLDLLDRQTVRFV